MATTGVHSCWGRDQGTQTREQAHQLLATRGSGGFNGDGQVLNTGLVFPLTGRVDEGGPSDYAQPLLWVLGGHGEGLPEERARVKHLVSSCNGVRKLPFALLMPSL